MAIDNFKHNGLRRFADWGDARKLPQAYVRRIKQILAALTDAETVTDIARDGLALHPLKGDRKGQWAVKVSGNLRIVFRFENGNAHDIDLIDYH